MRKLLGNRRGTVAFATVVALVPVIGAMALGGEAATWYVTKQEAQIAADAAAYSGALKLACERAPSSCTDGQSVDYRGKQFASQNAFCNAGDTSYPGSRCTALPSGITHSVAITQPGGNLVQATVSQQQPAYLATVLGLTTVNIGATAVAQVIKLANPCVVSLQQPISFKGSTTVVAPNCGLSSNSTASNSVDFTGNGLNVSNAGTISGQGGCSQTGGSQCDSVVTYAPPVPNPLSGLDAPMATLSAASFANGKCGSTLTAYTAAFKCYNDKFDFKSATYSGPTGLNGVYFFGGDVKINGSPTIDGTATFVLLPGATLTIGGNPTITLTGLPSVSTAQVPPALASVVGLMSDLLIYTPETTASNKSVKISGNSTSYFKGIVYAPNATVEYTGSTVSSQCTQVIAKGVTLSGNSNFDNSACQSTSKAESHIVRMVQ